MGATQPAMPWPRTRPPTLGRWIGAGPPVLFDKSGPFSSLKLLGGCLALLVSFVISAPSASGLERTIHLRFDGDLKDPSGFAPATAEGLRFGPGHEGKAAIVDRPALLAYPTDGMNLEAFTISFRVRHEESLEDHFFRRLVYFWHETADMKNRIGILKRAGSNSFVFFFSDNQGRAKGANFGGDWFAMATAPMEWESGSWHHVRCTADRSRQIAQFFIDDRKVAEATGTQFPEKSGDVFWVGTEQGHSWMRGAIDDLRIEPLSRLEAGAVVPPTATHRQRLAPAPRILGKSVGELTGKEFTINLDFFDICIGSDTWDMRDCDAEMERLMAMCAHYGVDRVYFRVSICGAVCYHTKVMTPAYDGVFEAYTSEGLDGCCANIPSLHRRMGMVMREIDPLACCAKYAHKHGMEVYAWVTVFDSMYYAPETEFFQRHPEFTWVSRDGTKHVPGVPCYAYPEVCKYRLDQVRELLRYDVDGVKFSPRSHSPWPGRGSGGGNEGARGYGFNEPVVREYVRRYGKDPRTAEADGLDELRFVQLKADFFTEFLREAKTLISASGKRLVVMTSTSIADPVRANWMYVDAETIAREKIADELSIMGGASTNLDHWRLLAGAKIKMTTWAGIHGETYEQCLDRMRIQFRAMLDNPTSDGSAYHELANLIYPDCWEEAIVDTVRRWQGDSPARE